MTHFVLGVIAASTALGSSVKVSSISNAIGTAPQAKQASELATKVMVGIITSSPAPVPAAASATVNAAVPLDTRWQFSIPIRFGNAFSNSFAIQWLLR